MRDTRPVLKTDVEMLRHASEVYTPKFFKLFEEEYMKVWDCTIDKISKTEGRVEYKVKYDGRGAGHRVWFESSSQAVECSCMKFEFVGILCAHALKVIDKKNIKHIPQQYISKRWTKDAKDGDLRSSVRVEGSSEKLTGKRYFNMHYNFREISALAAESDRMYEHASEVFSNLLKDLQEMKKCSNGGTSNEILCSNNEEEYPSVAGVKSKATIGRPKGRIRGALERQKSHKVQSKSKGKKVKASSSRQVESSIEVQIQNNQVMNNDQFQRSIISSAGENLESTPCVSNISFKQLLQDISNPHIYDPEH
ncbi:unnamed protein product [Linum trigynum]